MNFAKGKGGGRVAPAWANLFSWRVSALATVQAGETKRSPMTINKFSLTNSQ
jgi:hypothetical protein